MYFCNELNSYKIIVTGYKTADMYLVFGKNIPINRLITRNHHLVTCNYILVTITLYLVTIFS